MTQAIFYFFSSVNVVHTSLTPLFDTTYLIMIAIYIQCVGGLRIWDLRISLNRQHFETFETMEPFWQDRRLRILTCRVQARSWESSLRTSGFWKVVGSPGVVPHVNHTCFGCHPCHVGQISTSRLSPASWRFLCFSVTQEPIEVFRWYASL